VVNGVFSRRAGGGSTGAVAPGRGLLLLLLTLGREEEKGVTRNGRDLRPMSRPPDRVTGFHGAQSVDLSGSG
jgi:hypothetical protein